MNKSKIEKVFMNIFPAKIHSVVLGKINFSQLNEIRIRVGKPIVVLLGGLSYFLSEEGITNNVENGIVATKQDIENIVFRGIMFGTVLSLFSWKKKWLFELLGKTLLTIFGMSAGIFVGCLAVALAEILDTFPIVFRRIHLKDEFGEVLLFTMALGKLIGSLFFFFTGYDTITP